MNKIIVDKLSVNKLRKALDVIHIEKNSYINSYQDFIEYFENIDCIEKHHLVIASHFVYGWMPTILTLRLESESKVLDYLNKVKNGSFLKIDELNELKACVNNSLVGVSKLLHFINPNKYAIWDSKIYRYATNKKPYNQRVNNVNLYLDYLSNVNELVKDPGFAAIRKKINSKVGYEVTGLRAAELVMYSIKSRNEESTL